MLPASRATSPRRTSSLVEAHDSRVTIDSRAARRAWRRMFAFSWRGSRPSRPAARGPHAPLAGADGESAMQYTYAVGAAFVPNGGGIHARVTRGRTAGPRDALEAAGLASGARAIADGARPVRKTPHDRRRTLPVRARNRARRAAPPLDAERSRERVVAPRPPPRPRR